MPRDNFFDTRPRLRSGWPESGLLMLGPLTDKRIAEYQKRGFYSAEFREQRRELAARRSKKRERREGNWVERDGRMVYSPL